MGLFKQLFSSSKAARLAGESVPFEESTPASQAELRNAPRRELVHVVLRDTMRAHGIPMDWMDCIVLAVTGPTGTTGLHVQLVVRQGHDRLLAYVPAFQDAYLATIRQFDPRASDWMLSLSWQFDGMTRASGAPLPDPASWSAAGNARPQAASQGDQALEEDLQALYAIRDQAIEESTGPVDFQPTQPGL